MFRVFMLVIIVIFILLWMGVPLPLPKIIVDFFINIIDAIKHSALIQSIINEWNKLFP